MFIMSCTPVQNTINTTTSEVYVSASQDDVLLKSIEEETLESEQEIKTSQQYRQLISSCLCENH